jgi:hypothetical protein
VPGASVIGNDGAHLELCPALLREYTRHQVKSADYPAVVPYAQSRAHLFEKDLAAEDRCVRGTLVRGLTKADMDFLDVFEGDVSIATIQLYSSLIKHDHLGIHPRNSLCASSCTLHVLVE